MQGRNFEFDKKGANRSRSVVSSFPGQVIIRYVPLIRFRDDVVDHDVDHRTGREGKCIR